MNIKEYKIEINKQKQLQQLQLQENNNNNNNENNENKQQEQEEEQEEEQQEEEQNNCLISNNNNNNLFSSFSSSSSSSSSSLLISIPNNPNNHNPNSNTTTNNTNDSLNIPTLYIYAILQRISPKIEKYKYLSQLLFNFLTQQINEPDYDLIKEWFLKKLDIDINEDEIGYLLQYLRIRIADQFFDSQSHHIFKAPSSKHYPRWSNKLKTLALKYQVPIIPVRSVITPVKEATQISTKPLNLPSLRKAYSLKRKSSSKVESILSPKSPPPLSPSFEKPSRLPHVKATTQHVQDLMQEHKEMSKHVSKIFHSKKLK